MSELLDRTLCAIDSRLGFGASQEWVTRVEVRQDGALVLTLEGGESQRWFVSEGGMVREVQPHEDERLPLCEQLAPQIEAGELRVLSWRPGRRIVLLDAHAETPLVVKGFRRGRSADAARVQELVSRRLTGDSPLRVPRLLGHDAERESLELEFLDVEEARIHPVDEDTFAAVGQGLRWLREGASNDELELFTVADELLVLERLEARVLAVRPPLADWAETFETTRRAAEHGDGAQPAREPVLTHRDLHDGQVGVSAQGVVLLDFDLSCRADPAIDAANLTAHLQLRALQGLHGATQRGVDVCSRAFITGLEGEVDRDYVAHLRLYQATTFLRLALLYSVRPRWSRLAPTLVAYARRSIDDPARD